MEDAKPQWEILTVQPIRDVGDDVTFFQGSLLRWDGDRDTINLGLGQRKFLLDKNILIGANAFYDHEFDVDHSRLGWGAEMLTSVGEARYNEYYHNSKTKKNQGRGGASEAAMDGRDYEIELTCLIYLLGNFMLNTLNGTMAALIITDLLILLNLILHTVSLFQRIY